LGVCYQADSSPVVCGDRVVVGSDDGRSALWNVWRKAVWDYEIGQGLTGSPAVNGLIAIGSKMENVYAFKRSKIDMSTLTATALKRRKALRSEKKSRPRSVTSYVKLSAFFPFGNLNCSRILQRHPSAPGESARHLRAYSVLPGSGVTCYFKVYTDKDSAAIRNYGIDVVPKCPLRGEAVCGREETKLRLFRWGTPSYLLDQLEAQLTDGMKIFPLRTRWKKSPSECEPATDHKLQAIRDLGVTQCG